MATGLVCALAFPLIISMLLPKITADILPPALVALPIFIVIKMPTNVFIAAGIIAAAIVILRKTWYANSLAWPAKEIAREKARQQRAAK